MARETILKSNSGGGARLAVARAGAVPAAAARAGRTKIAICVRSEWPTWWASAKCTNG